MLRVKLMLARLVRAMSRRLGRGGGTTLPGRMLLRLDKQRDRPARRRGSRPAAVLLSATNGKTTTASMIAGHPRARAAGRVVRNAAGSNMHWGIATALIDAGRRPGELGLFEVDEAWLPAVARELDAARRSSSATCSATSSTATASSSCSPTAGRSSWPSASGIGAVRAERGRPAGRRPRPGRDRASSTSASRTTRRRCPSSSTPPTRSTAATAARRTTTRPSTSATSAATAARTAAARGPSREVVAERVRARRDGGVATCRCARRRARSSCASPSRASTTSTTRSRRRPPRSSSGASLDDVKASLEAQAAAFGRVETIPVERPRGVDPAGQEPGRRERGPAHADARGRPARPLDRAERQDRRRPRRLLGLGRRLRAAGRARPAGDLLRDARRGDGAAAEVRRHRRRARRSSATSAARSTPPWRAGRRRARCSRCPPTRRCSSCATCSPSADWRGHGRDERDLARRRVRGLHRGPRAVARARGHGATGRCSTWAAAPAASRSTWPPAGSDVTGIDSDPELIDTLRDRAREREPAMSEAAVADARSFDLGTHVRARHLADAGRAAAGRPGRPRADARRGAPASASPAGCSRRRWRTRSTTGPTRSRCRRCRTSARRTAGSTRPRRSASGARATRS